MSILWKKIFSQNTTGSNEMWSLLQEIPLFDGLRKRELAAIERFLHKRSYVSGEVIFSEGDAGVGMYIVQSGGVEIINEKNSEIIAELAKGDFFGEIALINELPRSATARAKTPCKLFAFFQPDLMSLIESNPKIGVKVLLKLSRVLGERLIEANEMVEQLKGELARKNKTES